MSRMAPTLEAFFTDRLIRERNSSPNTIAAYRDTMRLLLTFASAQLKVEPSGLEIGDLDAPLIGRFLDHLEQEARLQPAHPQPEVDFDPRALPVRRPPTSRARGGDRSGTRDTT